MSRLEGGTVVGLAALPTGFVKRRGWWRRTCADIFEVSPLTPSFTDALHSVQKAVVLSTSPSFEGSKNLPYGRFTFWIWHELFVAVSHLRMTAYSSG